MKEARIKGKLVQRDISFLKLLFVLKDIPVLKK